MKLIHYLDLTSVGFFVGNFVGCLDGVYGMSVEISLLLSMRLAKFAQTQYLPSLVSCWVTLLAILMAVWMVTVVIKHQQLEICYSKVVQYGTDTLT